MSRQTKAPARPSARPIEEDLYPALGQTPPWTTEERVRCIEVMGQRITAYVKFMCKLGNMTGTSAESKDKAVSAFYERMAILEKQLGRIQEDLQLG
jgi:hypothetical protein